MNFRFSSRGLLKNFDTNSCTLWGVNVLIINRNMCSQNNKEMCVIKYLPKHKTFLIIISFIYVVSSV